MANGHGGRRRPANPAPVSGPGALSRRTDGKQPNLTPTGLPYGDAKALHAQEAIAPMPQDSAPATPAIPQAPQGAAPQVPQFAGAGLMAPTQRPDEPITHGVDIGPGAGSEVLPAVQNPMPDGYITNLLSALSATDTTGTAAQLLISARQRGV